MLRRCPAGRFVGDSRLCNGTWFLAKRGTRFVSKLGKAAAVVNQGPSFWVLTQPRMPSEVDIMNIGVMWLLACHWRPLRKTCNELLANLAEQDPERLILKCEGLQRNMLKLGVRRVGKEEKAEGRRWAQLRRGRGDMQSIVFSHSNRIDIRHRTHVDPQPVQTQGSFILRRYTHTSAKYLQDLSLKTSLPTSASHNAYSRSGRG